MSSMDDGTTNVGVPVVSPQTLPSLSGAKRPPTAEEIDQDHRHKRLKEIQHQLQEDADAAFPNDGNTRYTGVYVLLLCWADEDPKLPVSLELNDLSRVFSDDYGFRTETWQIPAENCHNEVSKKVMEFVETNNDSRHDLKIIYYGGHGMLAKNRQLAWANIPNRNDKAFRSVKWSGIQNSLEEAQSDVLILLDCCASGTANVDDGRGTTEVIAACGFNGSANPVGPHSFTRALVVELRLLRYTPSFTVSILFNHILRRIQMWMPEGQELQKPPLHVVLTQDRKLPRGIQLSSRKLFSAQHAISINSASAVLYSPPPGLDSLVSSAITQSQGIFPGSVSSNTLDISSAITQGIFPGPVSSNTLDILNSTVAVSLNNVNSELHNIPCLALHIWLQKSIRIGDFPVQLFADWVRMMPVLAQRVQVEAGRCDVSTLLKLIRNNLLDIIRRNRQQPLSDMRYELILTQETLGAAVSTIDSMELEGPESSNPSENLGTTVPDVKSLMEEAFNNFNKSIPEDDAYTFTSIKFEDVWKAVREIDGEQRRRRSAQNLRRVEPLLRGIEKYAKVIDVSFNETPFMQYIWGPMKFILQLASTRPDVFEVLLTAYADIGATLPSFDRYEKAFAANPQFQLLLAEIYCSLVDFHQRLYKLFQNRAWHLMFLPLWKDFGGRLNHIIESLQKCRDCFDTEAASFNNLEEKSRIRQQAREILEEDEKRMRITHLQESISWLSADDGYQASEYERISSRRHDETCKWIFQAPKMARWLTDYSEQPLLWLTGKPGAGKSTMCSSIIQHLEGLPELSTCYYFCSSQSNDNVCNEILRIVALQLLRKHTDVASLIANDFVYRGCIPAIAQMRNLLPQILEIVPPTRIVIDGLDECSPEGQRAVLKEIQALFCGSNIRCKVLVSSRKEVLIAKQLARRPQLSLDGQEEVDLDIRRYTKYHIQQLPSVNNETLAEIESILVARANGMFLYVRLMLQQLKHSYSDADLLDRAKSLPKGLQKAYRPILDRIMDESRPSDTRSTAVRILEWMSCSYRPLKIHEILDGIVFRVGCTTLNRETKFRKEVLDLCRPLIEDGPSNTIVFVHFSAKEYILSEEFRDGLPFIRTEDSHLNLALSCTMYLNSSLSLLPSNCTDHERADMVLAGFHGLLPYASQFWFKHLLKYFGLRSNPETQPPQELLSQLGKLLTFKKEVEPGTGSLSELLERDEGTEQSLGLSSLDKLPGVKRLISDILAFRMMLNISTPPKKISSDVCDADPTFFSAIRHHYQETVEAILGSRTPQLDLTSREKEINSFREMCGESLFLCRYIQCGRATDGFNTAQQRDTHEASHERRFRCGHTTCVYFSRGFPTRSGLNRHISKYHQEPRNGALREAVLGQQGQILAP